MPSRGDGQLPGCAVLLQDASAALLDGCRPSEDEDAAWRCRSVEAPGSEQKNCGGTLAQHVRLSCSMRRACSSGPQQHFQIRYRPVSSGVHTPTVGKQQALLFLRRDADNSVCSSCTRAIARRTAKALQPNSCRAEYQGD